MYANFQSSFFQRPGDEMISDSYPCTETFGGAVLEFESKLVQVGIGEIDIGANASAEGGDEEGAEDSVRTVNNIVDGFRLTETFYDKKSFMAFIKGYCKRVMAYLAENDAEEVDNFKTNSQAFVKALVGDFSNYQFFMGEAMDQEAGLAYMFYKEDGVIPYIAYFKHGLKGEKF